MINVNTSYIVIVVSDGIPNNAYPLWKANCTSVIGLVVKFSVAIRVTSGSPGFDSQITHVLFLHLEHVEVGFFVAGVERETIFRCFVRAA